MDEKKKYWLKLEKDFLNSSQIKVIKNMQNGVDYIFFYLAIMLESINTEGHLRFNDLIPYNEQMLASITDTNIDIVRSALKVFVGLGLIQILENGTIFIPDVAKRTGNESDSAERVRLYREKQKVLQSNNDVTKCNTNKEIDIEINKDIEINNNTNLINEIVSYLNQKCKTNYKAKTNSTTKHIKARINEGFTLQDFKSVIDKKSAEWLGTDMEKYLRPETLFGNKFESYLNQNTPNNKSSPSDTSKIPKGVII